MSELCKTCGEPVIWATHERTGKQAPIDVEPSADGNILLIQPDQRSLTQFAPIYRIATASNYPDDFGTQLRTSHFATCPQASMHRRNQ